MEHVAEATEVHRGHLHNANCDLGQVCHQGRGDIKLPYRPCFDPILLINGPVEMKSPSVGREFTDGEWRETHGMSCRPLIQ